MVMSDLKYFNNRTAEKFSSEHDLDPLKTGSNYAFKGVMKSSGTCKSYSDESSTLDFPSKKSKFKEDVNQQLSLDLESIDDERKRLSSAIAKYSIATKRLEIFAKRWKDLMDAVDNDPAIEELFNNIMILRKLSGNDIH